MCAQCFDGKNELSFHREASCVYLELIRVYPVRRVDGVWQFLCKFFHPISRFLLPLLEELKGGGKNTRIGDSTEKNKMRYNFHMNLYGT